MNTLSNKERIAWLFALACAVVAIIYKEDLFSQSPSRLDVTTPEPRSLRIATASEKGIYHGIAEVMSDPSATDRTKNSGTEGEPPYRLDPVTSSGSIYNIRKVMAREVDFAFVQSDQARLAFTGESSPFDEQSPWDEWPQKDLRTVVALHPETRWWLIYE